jgi:hypothetical protein
MGNLVHASIKNSERQDCQSRILYLVKMTFKKEDKIKHYWVKEYIEFDISRSIL